MTRVLVSNPYKFNKQGPAFAKWLALQHTDVALLNEMSLLHDDIRGLGGRGGIASGPARTDAGNNVILTTGQPRDVKVVKVCDEVPGSRVWKDRYYVRAVIDGVAWYALHANAVIQDHDGRWRDNEGARRWRAALPEISKAIREDLAAGLEVVVGGDLNWRAGTPVAGSPEWLFKGLGLDYVTTQVMWLAHSPGIRLDAWKRLPTPPGADGHPVIVADLTRLPKETPAVKFPPPNPPVVGGHPANNSGQNNHPATRWVIHSAVTPCARGMARRLGEMNRSGATGGSWHYATDPGEAIQCSYDRYVCWHAPPNPRSIGVEMADTPGPLPSDEPRPKGLRLATAKAVAAFQSAGRAWRWAKKDQRLMLRVTAELTAEGCLSEGIPIKFVGARKLRKGRHGITTHAHVSAAFGQSTHWDPGYWPKTWFMILVRRHAKRLRAEA